MTKKVIALVVTYNRKNLLIECVQAILNQTRPVSKLLVVDNASTDGTDNLFLEEDGLFHGEERITYLRLNNNLGGAGGFKKGLAESVDIGCDWIWLMDDDCIPETTALERLLDATGVPVGDISFLASNVKSVDGNPMNVPIISTNNSLSGYCDWNRYLSFGMVEIKTATFVSLLISSKAVIKIGLPIGSFFIWGDDTEYTQRLTRYYGHAYLVGNSIVVHKRGNAKPVDINCELEESRIRMHRYHVRNNLVIKKYYEGVIPASREVARNLARSVRCLVKGDGSFAIRLLRARTILCGVVNYICGNYEIEDLKTLLS